MGSHTISRETATIRNLSSILVGQTGSLATVGKIRLFL